ncbi:hypothetical protein KXX47_001299, partial [Aspergillus fumigatus]
MAFVYSLEIGRAKGWRKQSHPRMKKFDQFFNDKKNAYLSVYPDGRWELFLPVDIAGIECFSDDPTHK